MAAAPATHGSCEAAPTAWHPPDGVPDHISPSTIKSYLQCSLKFYFERVLRLPRPTSPSLHVGRCVHAGLQAFHLARWRKEEEPVKQANRAYYVAFNQADPEVDFGSRSQREKALECGARALEAYTLSPLPDELGLPLGVEVNLQGSEGPLPLPLVGIIDLVRQGHVPVDFKTVASTPNIEIEAFQHELQLTAYQLLVEENTGAVVEGRELVFLVKTAKPKVIRHRMPPADNRAKDRFWAIAEAAVDGIYHERWTPQPGTQCSWCAYRTECLAWDGGVPRHPGTGSHPLG